MNSTDEKHRSIFAGANGWRATILVATLAGLIVILMHAAGRGAGFLDTASVGLLVAGAGLTVGSLIGFLFGIPRSLQGEHPEQPIREKDNTESKNGAGGNDQQGRRRPYGANTNLETISDWLTKILVGVGLTQITKVPEKLSLASDYVGRAFTGMAGSGEVAPSATGLAYAALADFCLPTCGVVFIW